MLRYRHFMYMPLCVGLLCVGLLGCSGKVETPSKPTVVSSAPLPDSSTLPPTRPVVNKPATQPIAGPTWKGKPLEAWLAALKDPKEEVRAEAVGDGGKLPATAPEVVPALAKALQDEHRYVRAAAVQALLQHGAAVEAAVPALTQALAKDPDASVKVKAAQALFNVGPKAKPAQPQLLAALEEKDKEIRTQALRTLGAIDPAEKEILAKLLELLKDKDLAAQASTLLLKAGESAVPGLLTEVEKRHDKASPQAAYLLGRLKPKKPEAIASLERALADTSPELRQKAAEALGQFGADAVSTRPALAKLLQDEDKVVDAVRGALEKIGPGEEQLPRLFEVLKSEHFKGRGAASTLLAKVGKPAVPELVKTLSTTEVSLLTLTLETLGRIGPAAKEPVVITKLLFLLRDESDEVRGYAANALVKIGLDKEQLVPLQKLVQDKDAPGRKQAVDLLKALGAEAKPAVADLLPLLQSEDEGLKRAVEEALKKIDPEALKKK